MGDDASVPVMALPRAAGPAFDAGPTLAARFRAHAGSNTQPARRRS